MAKDLTTLKGGLPSYLKTPEVSGDLIDELGAGVQTGFPVLSFRGKVWRIKKGGEEQAYVNEDDEPIPSLEVVLVRGKPNLSKIFYEKGYEEGSSEKPDCFSMDGLKPDPSSPNIQHANCEFCPNNEWGSKVTPQGTKTKACADNRRLAVVTEVDLANNGEDATPILLRIPGASLASMKEYSERVLAPKGIPFYAVVTKLGFDRDAAYPKLTYKATRILTEDEYNAIEALRKGDDVSRILSEAHEIMAAASDDEEEQEQQATTPEVKVKPEKATVTVPTKKKAKKKKKVEKEPEPEPAEESTAQAGLSGMKADIDALLGTLD
jgi:hypothetical protein